MFESYDETHPHVDIVSRLIQASRSGSPVKASTREYLAMDCSALSRYGLTFPDTVSCVVRALKGF